MANVSLFQKVSHTRGGLIVSVDDMLNYTKNGKWKRDVLQYREKHNPIIKKNLPCWTGSGVFEPRAESGMKSHSGFIIIDIDKLKSEDEVNEIKAYIGADKYTSFCGVSCGGLGLFVGIKINPKKHKQAFKFIDVYYKKHYKIDIDYLDDLSRLRFVSYDPDIIINEKSEILNPIEEDTPTQSNPNKIAIEYKPREASNSEYINRRVSSTVENAKNLIIKSPDGQKRNNLLKAGKLLGGLIPKYIDFNYAYDILYNEISNKPNVKDINAAKKTILDSLEHGQKFTITITEYEQKKNIQHKEEKPYQVHKEERAEDDYLQRMQIDDYRETPLINQLVYDSLPPLLKEICNKYEGRKRDIMLVSAITSLSGIVNNVTGMYHNKTYNPNLFSFVVAPPGSGKGAIDLCFEMGYTTKHKLKEINEESLRQWEIEMIDYNKQNKQNQTNQPPDKPSKQRIYVPADISSAGLSELLNENNSLLMIDTEADTVGNIFKTDYGNYSPLLRKAFQHETHKAYRKTNKEDIEVENIKLSVLYAGTPDQISGIMKDANNGLFSRFMFYAFAEDVKFENPWATKEDFTQSMRNISIEVDRIRELRSFEMDMDDNQKSIFNAIFENYTNRYTKVFGENAGAVVFRFGLMAWRIAMIFTRLMQDEETHKKKVICPQQCFASALLLVETLIKHSFMILGAVESEDTGKISNKKSSEVVTDNTMIDRLPDAFTTSVMGDVAKSLGKSNDTVKRFVNKMIKAGVIKRVGHGKYEKLQKNS